MQSLFSGGQQCIEEKKGRNYEEYNIEDPLLYGLKLSRSLVFTLIVLGRSSIGKFHGLFRKRKYLLNS